MTSENIYPGEEPVNDTGERTAYIQLDSNNNVTGWGTDEQENTVAYPFNGFEELPPVLRDPLIYKYEDGEFVENLYVKGELKKEFNYQEAMPTETNILTNMLGVDDNYKKDKIACQVNKALEFLTENLDEEQAVQVPDLFEEWQPDKNYVLGKRLKYGVDENGVTQLYEVAQSHTSQENWDPKSTHSLYKQIGVTDSGYDIWTQPYGSEDAYNVGDIVFHNKILYISVKDNNVWEPGVYGWKEYE